MSFVAHLNGVRMLNGLRMKMRLHISYPAFAHANFHKQEQQVRGEVSFSCSPIQIFICVQYSGQIFRVRFMGELARLLRYLYII